MYQWFRKEGLISLRYDFIDLTINGKGRGIFALEESFGKELIENNQRREGPILKWDESLLFDSSKTTSGDKLEETDLFQAADVLSFSTTKMLKNETMRDNFILGRHMLTALRKGEASLGEVFDVERAAKTAAIFKNSKCTAWLSLEELPVLCQPHHPQARIDCLQCICPASNCPHKTEQYPCLYGPPPKPHDNRCPGMA
jgi:hypothetical protein